MYWFRTLMLNLANLIGLGFLWIDGQVRDVYEQTSNALRRYAIFTAIFVLVSGAIGHIGFLTENEVLQWIAYNMFAFNYAVGGILLSISIFKALPLIIGAKVGTGAVSFISQSLSPMGRFGGAAKGADAAYVLASRIWWSVIVSLHAFSLLVTVIPLYRNVAGFLIFFGSVVGIAYVIAAREIGGEWYDRYMTAILLLFVVAIVVTLINAMLPGELYTRVAGTWTFFTDLERLANTKYWVAVLFFVSAVGFIGSLIGVVLRYRSLGTMGSMKGLGFWAAVLLFMIFLGPRSHAEVSKKDLSVNLTTPSFQTQNLGGDAPAKPSSVQTAKVVQGPYLPNTTSGLEVGKAYKFPDHVNTYLYSSDGKFHWFASPAAFARHYGCDTKLTPLECAPIYEMPSTVSKGSFPKGTPIF